MLSSSQSWQLSGKPHKPYFYPVGWTICNNSCNHHRKGWMGMAGPSGALFTTGTCYIRMGQRDLPCPHGTDKLWDHQVGSGEQTQGTARLTFVQSHKPQPHTSHFQGLFLSP